MSTPMGPDSDFNRTPVRSFEPERSVSNRSWGADGATLAADNSNNVYVFWHAQQPGGKDEADRRLWMAKSADRGRNFGGETSRRGARGRRPAVARLCSRASGHGDSEEPRASRQQHSSGSCDKEWNRIGQQPDHASVPPGNFRRWLPSPLIGFETDSN
jgi:hypothetical protein